MSTLVGYKRFNSKDGKKRYCVAEIVSEFSQREASNGSVGSKAEEVFLPEDKVDYLNPSHIGKEIKFDYELTGGRAYIVDVSIISK